VSAIMPIPCCYYYCW